MARYTAELKFTLDWGLRLAFRMLIYLLDPLSAGNQRVQLSRDLHENVWNNTAEQGDLSQCWLSLRLHGPTIQLVLLYDSHTKKNPEGL